MTRTLIFISVTAIGLALSLLAGASITGNHSSPTDTSRFRRQATFTGRTRSVVRILDRVPPSPVPVLTPVATPAPLSPPPFSPAPSPPPVPTTAPTPEPIPEPVSEPTPEPTPEPVPLPTLPPVPPDLVIAKETFLAGRLLISRIGVDAPFEEKGLDANYVMQDPSGREAVAWYAFKSLPNGGGNIFLAGHLQLQGLPAVFWKVPELELGDRLAILAGGVEFHYSVVSKDLVTKADSLHAVIDPVGTETVTLMTCGGGFIPETGDYTHRWIVRAARIN